MEFITAAMTFAALTSCSSEAPENSTPTTTTTQTTTAISAESLGNSTADYSLIFSDRDLEQTPDDTTCEITLNGDSADIDGSGASVSGSVITISAEGVYRISGKFNGQIAVNAPGAKVQLVLDGADITCSEAAPICIADDDKTFITLLNENSVTDSRDPSSYDETADIPDSAIFSEDSITFSGTGTLNVNALYRDGIHSKDDVVITGGTISVDAANNGIKGKDYVAAADGNITVNSANDGIKATNTEETKGFVYVRDGSFNIEALGDGIQAETLFIAEGGDFNITSGGGSANAAQKQNDDFFGGRHGMQNNAEMTALANTETTDETSVRGIKAGTAVNISAGEFEINSADDSIHSNGVVTITGGNIVIDAGDKGIHSDTQLDISGSANVEITKSNEGLESAEINISGGTVDVRSSDDGFNASDGTSQGGMGTYSSDVSLNISGGTVLVDADGDGLDSNGDMLITGGTILVNGPENSGNGALDGNGEIIVNGGLLIAAGGSGMAESPGNSSEQNSLSATIGNLSAGTLVTLTDSTGSEILSFAPSKSFGNIVISSPDIKTGEAYTLYTGGTSIAKETHGLYETGGYQNDGTEAGSFTADTSTSYIGSQGSMGGGFGGKGQHGGDFGGGRGDRFGQDGDMTPPELPTDENGETVEPGDFNGKGGFGGMMTPPDGDTPPFGDMQPPTEEAQ